MDYLNFPPFYSFQPGYKLREQYVDKWIELILNQCIKTKTYQIAQTDPIFTNSKLKRQADEQLKQAIFKKLMAQNNAIQQGDKLLINFISVAKAADVLVSQLRQNFLENDVFTFFDIQETFSGTLLQNMPEMFLRQVLEHLQTQKQITLMDFAGPLDEIGVKVHLI